MRPRHIDARKSGNVMRNRIAVAACDILHHLLFIAMRNMQIGKQIHLVKQSQRDQFCILRIFFDNEIGQQQDRTIFGMELLAVQNGFEELIRANGMIQDFGPGKHAIRC